MSLFLDDGTESIFASSAMTPSWGAGQGDFQNLEKFRTWLTRLWATWSNSEVSPGMSRGWTRWSTEAPEDFYYPMILYTASMQEAHIVYTQ